MNYIIKNGDIYTSSDIMPNGSLVINGGKISQILEADHTFLDSTNETYEIIDADNGVVIPGFIDLHVHGGYGSDTTDSQTKDIEKIVDCHTQHGTTGLLLSTMSGTTYDELKESVKLISNAMEQNPSIIGIHLEGPFLNKEYCGMYPSESLLEPDIKKLEELVEISRGNIRMITIAPELDGALDLISWCAQNKIVPSMGHTNADYELVRKAINLGLSHVTHIFNAMPPMHHRQPEAIGAALMDDRLSVQVICDGIHLHPLTIKMIARLKKCHNICLITDAMRATGMPEGEYMLGQFEKVRYKDGCVTSSDGTLASTAITMIDSLKNFLSFGDVSFLQALQTVCSTPAKVLGQERFIGVIEEGYDADILIIDRDLNIKNVFIKGIKKC